MVRVARKIVGKTKFYKLSDFLHSLEFQISTNQLDIYIDVVI